MVFFFSFLFWKFCISKCFLVRIFINDSFYFKNLLFELLIQFRSFDATCFVRFFFFFFFSFSFLFYETLKNFQYFLIFLGEGLILNFVVER